MKIETLKNATFKVTMPCGKVFGGLYKDTLIEHCHAWQQRQNELATMLAENGYTVEALNEYDYKVIAGKVFVFSHLYNDGFILNTVTQKDLHQTAIDEELVVIAECEHALKDVTITAARRQVIEGFLRNAKKRLNVINNRLAIKDSKMALRRNIKKSLLFTVYIVDSKITCVRSNLTGKFIKKSVYVEIVNSEKLDHGVFTESKAIDVIQHITKIPYIGFALCALLLAMCFHFAMPTIKARQQAYEATYSNELLEEYYSDCSTDTECEQLESELKFDFKKGMN